MNTGSPVSSSDTVVEERRSSAKLCRKNARQVENNAKNTMMPQATGRTAATSSIGSHARAHPRHSAKATAICVPATVTASSSASACLPNTSAPASATDDPKARSSPGPTARLPPWLHRRYRPPATPTWKGMMARG